MSIYSLILNFLPIIIFVVLLIVLFLRAGNRTVRVYLIAAVKSDYPDKIEMQISMDKAEIDEWEKKYWDRGYRVSRKIEEMRIKRQRKGLYST